MIRYLVVTFTMLCAVLVCTAQVVSISPNPQITQVAQNFVVNARLDTTTQVRGCAVWISYDPAKITFVSAARGTLFNGYNVGWWRVIHESTTLFRVECIIFGAGIYTTGPGNLLNLTFNAIAGDFTTLQIPNIELYDIDGYVIPGVSANAGNVIIGTSPAYTQAKCWLQGPYSNGVMSTEGISSVPLTSPYTVDPITLNSLPEGTVDWVLVELRSTYNGAAVRSQSALLDSDGYLHSPDKPYLLFMNQAPGSYYIVLRHRNHLAVMTSTAVPLASSGTPPTLDMTIIGNIYGGSGVATVGTGIVAMAGGDADQNGSVAPTDRNEHWRVQSGLSGYLSADFNLDGFVAPSDLNGLWRANTGLSTMVP